MSRPLKWTKEELIKLIEKELHVKLPIDYVEFIKNYGTVSNEYYEIFGIDEEMEDFEKIPCVIGATKLYKKTFPIEDDEIVISFDDLLNEIVILNTTSGIVYRKNQQGKMTKVSSSFQKFLEKLQESIVKFKV